MKALHLFYALPSRSEVKRDEALAGVPCRQTVVAADVSMTEQSSATDRKWIIVHVATAGKAQELDGAAVYRALARQAFADVDRKTGRLRIAGPWCLEDAKKIVPTVASTDIAGKPVAIPLAIPEVIFGEQADVVARISYAPSKEDVIADKATQRTDPSWTLKP